MIYLQPNLIGKLVKLRPIKSQDFQALYKVSSDKLLWQQHPEPLRYQRDVFAGFFNLALQCKGGLIIQNADSEVIGSSRYYDYRSTPQKDIKIGYSFIGRKYWGSTYNRQIKHLMMTHIYQYVDNIFFYVGQKNLRSRLAMGKIGGKLLNKDQIKEYDLVVKPQTVVFEIKKKDFKGLI